MSSYPLGVAVVAVVSVVKVRHASPKTSDTLSSGCPWSGSWSVSPPIQITEPNPSGGGGYHPLTRVVYHIYRKTINFICFLICFFCISISCLVSGG